MDEKDPTQRAAARDSGDGERRGPDLNLPASWPGQQRRVLWTAAVCALLAAASMVTFFALDRSEPEPLLSSVPTAPDGVPGYVVSAYTTNHGGQVLDPVTGVFREIDRPWSFVASSPDLRYALTIKTVADGAAARPSQGRFEYALLDTVNGEIKQEIPMDDFGYATWSPDGRHLAFVKQEGPNRDDAVATEVLFRHVVTGRTTSVDVRNVAGVRSDQPVAWLADGSGVILSPTGEAGTDGRYVIATAEGEAIAVPGWPVGYLHLGPVLGADVVALWPGRSDEVDDALLIDARTGGVRRRYPMASVGFGGIGTAPLTGRSAVAWLGEQHLLFLDGQTLIVHDVATGTDRDVAALPDGVLQVHLASAASVSGVPRGSAVYIPSP